MDYNEKKYLKQYKPKPNRLYFHPSRLDNNYWGCCGVSNKCYKGKRGCKYIESNWLHCRGPVMLYDRKLKGEVMFVGRLPLALLKEVAGYLKVPSK